MDYILIKMVHLRSLPPYKNKLTRRLVKPSSSSAYIPDSPIRISLARGRGTASHILSQS